MPDRSSAPPEPAPSAPDAARPARRSRSRARLGSVGWLLTGALLTLAIDAALRMSEPATRTPSARSSDSGRPIEANPSSLVSAREQFATLYSSYLLNSYYVPSRGFCRPLLRKVCLALHHADLLADARECDTVPNDELVLAIGRYQHRVGLPVDGKAGPETVRMMLGGDFSNRQQMEATYCTEDAPSGPIGTAGR